MIWYFYKFVILTQLYLKDVFIFTKTIYDNIKSIFWKKYISLWYYDKWSRVKQMCEINQFTYQFNIKS